jgi:hypothetical protein
MSKAPLSRTERRRRGGRRSMRRGEEEGQQQEDQQRGAGKENRSMHRQCQREEEDVESRSRQDNQQELGLEPFVDENGPETKMKSVMSTLLFRFVYINS